MGFETSGVNTESSTTGVGAAYNFYEKAQVQENKELQQGNVFDFADKHPNYAWSMTTSAFAR